MKSINFNHFNTSTIDKGSNTKLCGYYQNVHGLRTKINAIKCSVSYFFYDFIILSETWLNEEFNDNELGFSQYNIFRWDTNINTSNLSRGVGVLIAINKNLNSKLIDTSTMNVEQIFIELIFNGLMNIICVVYIPPNSDLLVYLNHLFVVESLYYSNLHYQFIICGDYNVPSLSWASDKIGYKCTNFLTSNTGCIII